MRCAQARAALAAALAAVVLLQLCAPALASRSDDRAQALLNRVVKCASVEHDHMPDPAAQRRGYAVLIQARELEPPPRPFIRGQVELWIAKLTERIRATWSDRAESAAYEAATRYLRQARSAPRSAHEAALSAGYLGRAFWGRWSTERGLDTKTDMADEAMRWYSTALKSGKLASAESKALSVQLKELRYEEAQRCTQEPIGWFLLGWTTPERLISLSSRALQLRPQALGARTARGEGYRRTGDPRHAVAEITADMMAWGRGGELLAQFRMLAHRDAGEDPEVVADLTAYVKSRDPSRWSAWVRDEGAPGAEAAKAFLDHVQSDREYLEYQYALRGLMLWAAQTARPDELKADVWRSQAYLDQRAICGLRGVPCYMMGNLVSARRDLIRAADTAREFPDEASDAPATARFRAYFARDWLQWVDSHPR